MNPRQRKFAIRASDKSNRHAVQCSTWDGSDYSPRDIAAAAYSDTLFALFGWNPAYKRRIIGTKIERDGDRVFIFNAQDSEAFLDSYSVPVTDSSEIDQPFDEPLLKCGKRIRAMPKEWTSSFGQGVYYNEQSLSALERQCEADWNLHIQGKLYNAKDRMNITGFDELQKYIQQAISPLKEDTQCLSK